MYSRPLQSSRRRSALMSDQARRASVRQLFFEVLENRTLLAADLSAVDVRLTSASGLDSAPTMITSSTLAAASGLRMAIVNETSPNASDAAVDDRLLLRLSVSDAVSQNLVGVESQVRVTFDSKAVAVDSTREFEDVTANLFADNLNSLSYVLLNFDQEVQRADALVVEIPFRVIARRTASISAQLTTVSGSVHLDQIIKVDLPVETRGSGPVNPLPNHSSGSSIDGDKLDGTIEIKRHSLPAESSLIGEPDSDPFSSFPSTFDTESNRASKSIADSDLFSSTNAALSPSKWSLSPDASWIRHRTFLLLDGDRELLSRRSGDKSSDRFSSRLLNQERPDSRPLRAVEYSLDLIYGEKPGRTSPRKLSIDRMFFTSGSTQLEDRNAEIPRVLILSPGDTDAVLAQWKAKASSSTPRQK